MASKPHDEGTGATILRLRPDAFDPGAPIVLAQLPPFRLGQVKVEPARLRLVHDDGREEKLQPRIMQVLVALARAEGGIVTRDALTDSCWDGRIVGEDAISRAIVKIRRLADGIGAGAFAIETVSKIGYRLSSPGGGDEPAPAASPSPSRPSRRLVIAGGAAAALTGGAALWLLGRSPLGVAADDALFRQALAYYRERSPEDNQRARALLQQLVQQRPDHADGWGLLAACYFRAYWNLGYGDDAGLMMRGRAAAARAQAIDPGNPYAALATITMLPLTGHWRDRERIATTALARAPDNDLLLQSLGWTYANVGRWTAAIGPVTRAIGLTPETPILHYLAAISFWSSNRLEEADRTIDQGLARFPGYYALWFARFYVDLFTGRLDAAIALAQDSAGRPVGIPQAAFDLILTVARALQSHRPDQIETAMQAAMDDARHSVGATENALQYACAFGRSDTAFLLAEALYFGRPFDPGEMRFDAVQGRRTRHGDRMTLPLFFPCTAPMRADPRFAALADRLGLSRYWRETGTQPDFRR